MIRKHIPVIAVLLVMAPLLPGLSAEAEPAPQVRIAILTDGPHTRGLNIVDMIQSEVREVCGERYAVEFPGDAALDGGWSPHGATAALEELLLRPDIDLVLAIGVESGRSACALRDPEKAVVVPFAFAECGTTCQDSPNLRINSINLGRMMARDLHAFREIVPYSRVALIAEPAWIAGCNQDHVAAAIAPAGTEAGFVPLRPGGANVVDDLPDGTDAIYLMHLQQIDEQQFLELINGLTAAGLPTFSLAGERDVEHGVLASLNTTKTISSIARGVAVDVLDALDGRAANPAPLLDYGARLTVNLATARELGLAMSWEVLSNADLIHKDIYRSGLSINLETTLARAVEANLDLLVRDREVAAGAEDIREARSGFRPQLDLAAYGVAIDSDRAFAALGNYERYAAGSLELTQLVYSDMASANVTMQKSLHDARVSDRESLRLDITRTAADAYLDLMRAEALIRIRQDDVDLNRTNLDMARLRRSLGSAASAEIYRWEAQLAAARAALLEAISARRLGERQLSRLLDYSVSTDWETRPPTLDEGLMILGGTEQAPLLDSPSGYEVLSDTLLSQGLAASPELEALDAVIAAQQRAHTAARRESYVPAVGLSAQFDRIFAKSDGGGIDLGEFGDMIPGVDDTTWNVGLRVSLPLSTGGATRARRIKADEQLSGLRLQRRSASDKLSQRILSALDRAAASWPGITLRRQSADAAARTLELMQDAYGRGAASILDLLDAQNAALTADLAAETAVYDFLKDWAEVQRSVAAL